MMTINSCPMCGSETFEQFLDCIDYTVSRETFSIRTCKTCSFQITTPRPANNEIAKYYQSEDYISHTNKAASLIDRIYLLARRYTLSWKLNLLHQYSTGTKTLLDYGCGTGAFLQYAQQHQWEITGIEPASDARKIAIQQTKATVHSSVNELGEHQINIITLWHVLEHVPDLNHTLQQLANTLEKNGTMFIAVPNYNSWDAKLYKEHWAGFDVPRHLWHFSQKTMAILASKNNLKIVKTIPMKLDAFYISLLSEKYKQNKVSIIGLAKAFVNGLRSNVHARNTTEYSSLIYVIKK